MPENLIRAWRAEFKHVPSKEADNQIRLRVQKHLDKGTGPTWLKTPSIARIVENTLLHFDTHRYRLHAWVVMPNHVHFLITANSYYSIPDIVHSLKSFTAKNANHALGRKGRFWQPDYFDRFIRNESHYIQTVDYIELNPVKARLCALKEQWEFSSAFAPRVCGRDARAPGE